MTFLRWISCHLILTIVVVSGVVAWYYRDALATDYARLTGKEIATPVAVSNETVAQQEIEAAPAPVPAPAPSMPSGQSTDASPRVDPVPGQPSIDVVESQQVDIPGSQPADQQSQPDAIQPGMFPPPEMPGPAFPEPGRDVVFPGQQQAASQFAPPVEKRVADSAPLDAPPRAPDSGSMFPPDDYDPETVRVAAAEQPGAGMMGADAPLQERPDAIVEPRFPAAVATVDDTPMPSQSRGQQDQSGYEARLETARRLLWAGDLDNARHEYEGLMAVDPSNPEVASELGNLLMQQDRVEKASQVYDAAIANFRRQQRDNEAIGLIRFISRYNPALADSLYNKYWQ